MRARAAGTQGRVFASSGGAPAYAYDPYGNPLQATAPLTDFGYAGMFRDPDSALSLTLYRAYDRSPAAGCRAIRWASSAIRRRTSTFMLQAIPYRSSIASA